MCGIFFQRTMDSLSIVSEEHCSFPKAQWAEGLHLFLIQKHVIGSVDIVGVTVGKTSGRTLRRTKIKKSKYPG